MPEYDVNNAFDNMTKELEQLENRIGNQMFTLEKRRNRIKELEALNDSYKRKVDDMGKENVRLTLLNRELVEVLKEAAAFTEGYKNTYPIHNQIIAVLARVEGAE